MKVSYDNVSNYRIDRITDVEMLSDARKPMKSIKGLESGLDVSDYIAPLQKSTKSINEVREKGG